MSGDGVDDLHAAEDFAGSAVAALEEILRLRVEYPWTGLADLESDDRGRDVLVRVRQLVFQWEGYCRPTCGAEGDPTSEECDDDSCGCPCGHTDVVDVADRPLTVSEAGAMFAAVDEARAMESGE